MLRSILSCPTRRSSDLGAGWNIQRFGWDQWMLHTYFPDLMPKTYALQALSFVLGVHPGSNTASFVSGVGARSDRKSTRLNSSHLVISYAVFCLKKKKYI